MRPGARRYAVDRPAPAWASMPGPRSASGLGARYRSGGPGLARTRRSVAQLGERVRLGAGRSWFRIPPLRRVVTGHGAAGQRARSGAGRPRVRITLSRQGEGSDPPRRPMGWGPARGALRLAQFHGLLAQMVGASG